MEKNLFYWCFANTNFQIFIDNISKNYVLLGNTVHTITVVHVKNCAKHTEIILKSYREQNIVLKTISFASWIKNSIYHQHLKTSESFSVQYSKDLLTVALSSTLMEYGSATLCFLSACSSSCKGGRSHFPKTTRSISLDKKNTAWDPLSLKHNSPPTQIVKLAFYVLQVSSSFFNFFQPFFNF